MLLPIKIPIEDNLVCFGKVSVSLYFLMILNWLSVLIGSHWTFPLTSCTMLAFIETIFPYFSITVSMGVVVFFVLLAPNVNTVSLTLPSGVSFNFLRISSVIYALWLPLSINLWLWLTRIYCFNYCCLHYQLISL